MGSGERKTGLRATLAALVAAIACIAIPAIALAAGRDFNNPASSDSSQQLGPGNVQRADTPNDPDYDRAEADDPDSTANGGTVAPSTNVYDERFDLFGFASPRTPLAIYKDPSDASRFLKPQVSGFNAAGAWKKTRGSSSVAVAILDTGIKWDREALRTQIRLNGGELPTPQHDRATSIEPGQNCSTYTNADDANGDGAFNVVDYSCDSRVDPAAGPHGNPSRVDAEDLIYTPAFADGTDADANGFVDDIAGWDFFDNDNNPYDASSYFAAANHGSGRAMDAAESGNDGQGAIGVCPKCQVMPIRTWDTFVSDGNTFGMGMLYATDNGAAVIEGANGSLYHSAFAEAASQYAYEHGAVQVYSGDDLNTANHNYAANYNHTMLIQGTVPDTIGLGYDFGPEAATFLGGLLPGVPLPGTDVPPQTYFRGANTTQFGGHSSISMEGSTGSENTGKAAGAAGLVISAAREDGRTLRPDETREILEQTAEDITAPNTAGLGLSDPAHPGWDLHFGYGRADVGAAVALAKSGDIPPEASITSPDWYAPETGDSVDIKGRAEARFASGQQFSWQLQWAPGLDPEPGDFQTVHSGSSDGQGNPVTDFGSIDLTQVRAALAAATPPVDTGGPTFAPGGPNPYKQDFTVRLVVDGAETTTNGVDRKVLTAFTDPTLRSGFPKRLGTGGEAPIRYADLDGDNTEELIVPLEDGKLHAYEPDGSELAGWPVQTGLQYQSDGHGSAPGFTAVGRPHEPLRGPVIADLDGDGKPEVISAAGDHIYAWEGDGSLRPGFPVESDRSQCTPDKQSQPLHHPKCGFLATPAIAYLDGRDQPPSIVEPGLDGLLYVVRPDGSAHPNFPKRLVDPGMPANQQMIAESINNPAVGDLNGDGKDDIVIASNEAYGSDSPSPGDLNGGFAQGLSDILGGALGGSSRVYAVNGATGNFLPGWPLHLNGAIQDTLPFIGPGHDASIGSFPTAGAGKALGVVVSTTGGALSIYSPTGTLVRTMQQNAPGAGSNETDPTGAVDQINLFESAVVGDVSGSGSPDVVKYGVTLGQLANLALTGQNIPYNHVIGAYDSGTGNAIPHFPTVTDDYQFLSSSTVAKVDPASGANQVLAGTGLGLLHAYDGDTGVDAPGFPKQTGGWLFAPAALSDDQRMAAVTREGYLFQWNGDAPSCQGEWPEFRHDQQSTGDYDTDGTPPGAITDLTITDLGEGKYRISFTSPGDDRLCGTPDGYVVRVGDTEIKIDDAVAPGETVTKQLDLGSGAAGQTLKVLTRDEAGNLGYPDQVTVPGGDVVPTPKQCRITVDQTIAGGSGPDTFAGGPGADGFAGRAGNDSLAGGAGNDCLLGQNGQDKLSGNKGDDFEVGGKGSDSMLGNSDDDTLHGGEGQDRINGGDGTDRVNGGSGNDKITGGHGSDELSGGSGDDRISGDDPGSAPKPDVIRAGSGDDVITAQGRGEVVKCGSGHDKVIIPRGRRPKLTGCEKVVHR